MSTQVDFKERPPVVNVWNPNISFGGAINMTFCDSTGHLLFYANKYNLYNKNKQDIGDFVFAPNILLYSVESMGQGNFVLPLPGHPGRYCFFRSYQSDAPPIGLTGNDVYLHLTILDQNGIGSILSDTLMRRRNWHR